MPEAASKTLRDGVSIQKESDQECGDEAKAILEYSSSPWFTRLSLSPDSLTDSFGKFMASSFPALAGGSSHLLLSHRFPRVDPSVEGSSPMASLSTTSPAEGNLEVGYRCSSISSGVAGVAPTVGDSSLEQVGVVGKLSESRRALDTEVRGCSPVVGVGDASGAVHASRSAASRGRHRGHSEELGFRLSRFNGSSWISFRSQHSQQFELKSGDTVDGISQRGDADDPDRRVPEEVLVQSSEQPEVMQEVPTVVPFRAWVDEVKTLKQGDIYVGRGSKQRGLLPSFWANWYKVSEFGRDR